jgi:hypothetical protein
MEKPDRFPQKIWRGSFLLFAPLSLSSMAGMSIGSGLFLLASLFALVRGWATWGKDALREVIWNAWGFATAAFFLAALLSLVFAAIFPPLGIPVYGFAELAKFHHFLYPPLIALALLRTADSLDQHPFWKWWGAAGLVCFVLATAQFFGRDLFPEPWLSNRFFRAMNSTGRFHGQGLMYFHLSFAACLSFVAAAGLARFLFPLNYDSPKERGFWGVVGVGGCLAVYFAFSRIGLAGLVAIIIILGFLRRPLLGLASVAFCALVGSGLWIFMPSLSQRFREAASYNDERYIMWQTAWKMFEARPLLGMGFGRSGKYSPEFARQLLGHDAAFTSHAHDNVLDLLASVGALGLAAFAAWWIVLFVWAGKAFRQARAGEEWLPAAAIAGFIAFQINGITQVNFWDGKSQHTLMLWAGVVIALEVRRRRRIN